MFSYKKTLVPFLALGVFLLPHLASAFSFESWVLFSQFPNNPTKPDAYVTATSTNTGVLRSVDVSVGYWTDRVGLSDNLAFWLFNASGTRLDCHTALFHLSDYGINSSQGQSTSGLSSGQGISLAAPITISGFTGTQCTITANTLYSLIACTGSIGSPSCGVQPLYTSGLNGFGYSVPGSAFLSGYSTQFGLSTTTALTNTFFGTDTASTTLGYMQSRCSDSSNAFSEGICMASVFLFVPDSSSIGQFSNLISTLRQKFPFSYVVSVLDVLSGYTDNGVSSAPSYSINLHDTGIGSTTPVGNVLPNFTGFSSSTVKQYFPPGVFDLLKTLAGIAILLTFIADIFFSVRNMLRK